MKKVAAAKGKRSGADRLHANDLHTNQFPLPVLPAARPFARPGTPPGANWRHGTVAIPMDIKTTWSHSKGR